MRVKPIQIATGAGGSLRGNVYSSELLGECTQLTERCGGALVCTNVGPAEGMSIGDEVGLMFEQHNVQFFVQDSGKRFTYACW